MESKLKKFLFVEHGLLEKNDNAIEGKVLGGDSTSQTSRSDNGQAGCLDNGIGRRHGLFAALLFVVMPWLFYCQRNDRNPSKELINFSRFLKKRGTPRTC